MLRRKSRRTQEIGDRLAAELFARRCRYPASPKEATQEKVGHGRKRRNAGYCYGSPGIPLPIILLIWLLGGLHG